MLAALGQTEELRAHLAGALNVGLTRDELVEVLMHVSIYAGVPATAPPCASPPTSSAPQTPDLWGIHDRACRRSHQRTVRRAGWIVTGRVATTYEPRVGNCDRMLS